jgi:hypothetical protein
MVNDRTYFFIRIGWALVMSLLLACVFANSVYANPARVQISQSSLNPNYVISAPGSYILTENLLSTSGVATIVINANDVWLDLNGHVIFSATNFSVAVAQEPGINRTTIRNGTISGFTALSNPAFALPGSGNTIEQVRFMGCRDAVLSGSDTSLRDVSIFGMAPLSGAGSGAIVGANSRLNRVEVRGMDVDGPFTGLETGDQSILVGCRVIRCTGDSPFTAIRAGRHSVIVDCDASSNSGGLFVSGITVSSNSVIRSSAAHRNTASFLSSGINLSGPGVIANSIATEQGSGISAGPGAMVTGNTVISNSAVGINLNGRSYALRNHANMNGLLAPGGAGIVAAQIGNRIEDNSAVGNLVGIRLNATNNLVIANRTSINTSTNILINVAPNHVGLRRTVTGTFSEKTGTANINY